MSRALQWLALVLAFVVLGASSGLRLADNGLSCTPWPACYGKPDASQAAQASAATATARAIHRVAATVFALVAAALVAVGWRRKSASEHVVAFLLLAVTIGLAWLGRHTPSTMPGVTVANVLGGLTLIGLLAWMLAHASVLRPGDLQRPSRDRNAVAWLLLLALVAQAAGGALISVRLAGSSCALLCERVWLPGAGVLWHIGTPGSAVDLLGHPQAGQPLFAWHALFGLALLLLGFFVAAARGGDRAARRLLFALAATAGAGLLFKTLDSPLLLAVAHALLVGATIAALAALLAPRHGASPEVTR